MPQSDNGLLIHFLPWVGMILIMFANRFTAQRRQEKRTTKEEQALRIILQLELGELLVVYDDNLRHIAEQQPYLLSGRPFLTVSKGNLARLAAMDMLAIPAIIAAIAYNERIEGSISMQAKPVGNTVYRLEPNSDSLEDIRLKLLLGREKISAALAVLQSGVAPKSARVPSREQPSLATHVLLAPAAAEP